MKRVIVLPPLDLSTGAWVGRHFFVLPACCAVMLTPKDFL